MSDKDSHVASTAVIVADRSQEAVEAELRQMKDPKVVSFSPMLHLTDQRTRVHALYCVLALIVARLMVREADHHGIHMSVRELLDTLAGIQETVLAYQGGRGRPRARRMPTQPDPTQRRRAASGQPPTSQRPRWRSRLVDDIDHVVPASTWQGAGKRRGDAAASLCAPD